VRIHFHLILYLSFKNRKKIIKKKEKISDASFLFCTQMHIYTSFFYPSPFVENPPSAPTSIYLALCLHRMSGVHKFLCRRKAQKYRAARAAPLARNRRGKNIRIDALVILNSGIPIQISTSHIIILCLRTNKNNITWRSLHAPAQIPNTYWVMEHSLPLCNRYLQLATVISADTLQSRNIKNSCLKFYTLNLLAIGTRTFTRSKNHL